MRRFSQICAERPEEFPCYLVAERGHRGRIVADLTFPNCPDLRYTTSQLLLALPTT